MENIFDNLFVASDPLIENALRVDFPEDLTYEEIEDIFTARKSVTEPIVLHQDMGSQPRDVIWTSAIKPLLIRDSVVDLLEQKEVTGWSTYPIDLPDVPSGESYRGLSITGRAGEIDDSRSQITMKQYPARLAPVHKGLYFDPSTWDGSDLFVTEDANTWLFASSKVKSAFDEAGISDVDLVPAGEFERPIVSGEES
jgi:ribosomal protein L24E